ncbi:ABC transporter ATP-binding protein [Alicyclobacillus hesperidum subsp. aegles]|uniref:ABC-type multidrug transport system, ATPase component n=1 Tax=Alicyclobacillus tolerans TaxID=90970 RepID=A0A1M6NWR1_9BACL|nr:MULTISPECIES: ABC transporter ATP-binding protein [Alicyclobacillus]KRW90735.1 ABC transporter ATP-binding protein [Alicyclobacillus tengchongensis]GLG01241.1 ABC transporter ATP-binding protein [Alicyclobacillus hesperidum subsp. aegles]SHK00155.1 ABC-type multidrug transport system, ATPase component [Alicyclobacillus montanus]
MKLQIENISKSYRGKNALKNFNVELSEGVHALLGPNGAGKSTLMRIIAGILRPSAGRVLVDGEDITTMGEDYRDILGYLPQSFGLYKRFTAERFLMYIAALKGLDKSSAERKVSEMLQLVNLDDVRHVKVGKFSGGMKQRLGIAQALLNDPKILIVDEPTAGLDPKERIRFRNLLSDFSTNRIVLLSTHIISDVEFVAQDVLIIKNGQLVNRNTPEGFLRQIERKVWSLTCTERQVSTIQQQFQVGSVTRTHDGVSLRIVSDQQPLPNAETVTPTLEDLYLYYFGEEATSDEATVTNAV